MDVYIEYIFLDNLAINMFLLYLTLYLLKKRVSFALLICSAIVGAFFSVLYPFLGNFNYVVKILLAPVLILIINKYKHFSDFCNTLVTFYLVSFCLAGTVIMLNSFTIINLTKFNGELQLIPFCLFGSSLIILVLLKFCRSHLYRRKQLGSLLFNAKVRGIDNKKISIQAFYDSGNQLYDPKHNTPIVIISDNLYNKIPKENLGNVLVKTVAGYKSLVTVNIEFRLYFSCTLNKMYKVQAGVSDDINREYDMILHTEMTGE